MKQNPGDNGGVPLVVFFTAVKRIVIFVALVVVGWLIFELFISRLLHGTRLDQVFAFLLLWFISAYIFIPMIHRVLTRLYIPDYFIGRIRTVDGLLSDPVNLAFIGNEEQLHEAMTKAGWVQADKLTIYSGIRFVVATLLRKRYDHAPVSPGYLFNQMQAFTYQHRMKDKPLARHHVRFFKVPDGWLMPGGYKVDWLAAGTFDRSIGFSYSTLQITHHIVSDTDIERDHVVSTLKTAGVIRKLDIIKNYFSAYHHRNGYGDRIMTDGSLPIIELKH
jgi:hypothetical protein